ncbi:MAG: cytochrome c oxidase assembly protein [Bryobacteraceae bacterium]|jgi:putative membrane protein
MNLWNWEPSVVAGCAILGVGYGALVRKHGWNRAPYFLAGLALLLLDLVSPIDTLADQYLFSAHIVQHFLLALVIPPLLLLGIPRWFAETALRRPKLNRLERTLGQPPVSWLLGVGTMLAWHIPTLFNAALAHDSLHIFQHLTFLVTGTIFWWPIVGPQEDRRLPMLASVSYLFGACVCCSLLGAFLTFGPVGLYPAYLNPPARLWGLDPRSDQQLGGMLMWVPGCFVYLSGIVSTVMRWYSSAERAA